MSFLFGARGHRDPELAAANQRQRAHFARDINDERALADQAEVPIKRRSPWVLLALVTLFFLAAAFVRGGSDPVPIARSCTQPSLVVQTNNVSPGANLRLRSTGPQDAQYILAIDGQPVQGQPDAPVTYSSTSAGPAYGLTDCVSAAFLVEAPIEPGQHTVSLLQYAAGQVSQAASLPFTVSG